MYVRLTFFFVKYLSQLSGALPIPSTPAADTADGWSQVQYCTGTARASVYACENRRLPRQRCGVGAQGPRVKRWAGVQLYAAFQLRGNQRTGEELCWNISKTWGGWGPPGRLSWIDCGTPGSQSPSAQPQCLSRSAAQPDSDGPNARTCGLRRPYHFSFQLFFCYKRDSWYHSWPRGNSVNMRSVSVPCRPRSVSTARETPLLLHCVESVQNSVNCRRAYLHTIWRCSDFGGSRNIFFFASPQISLLAVWFRWT